jgi:hypothetical protein
MESARFREDVNAALDQNGGSVMAHVRICAHGKTLHVSRQKFNLGLIHADVHFVRQQAPMKFEIYEQTDENGNVLTFQHAHAKVGGREFRFLLPEGIRSKKIVIDVSSDTSCGHVPRKRAAV